MASCGGNGLAIPAGNGGGLRRAVLNVREGVVSRIGAVSEAINSELRARPRAEWEAVLENRSSSYGVKFLLFHDDGHQLAGEPTVLPEEMKQSLRGRGPDRHGQDRGRGGFRENRPTNVESSNQGEERDRQIEGGGSKRKRGCPCSAISKAFAIATSTPRLSRRWRAASWSTPSCAGSRSAARPRPC